MSKFNTAYFENFDKEYDDFFKQGLNFDDFLLKTKFKFNKNYTFSSKSKFRLGEKSSLSHEYGVKHSCNRGSVEFKHKEGGEVTLEVDQRLADKDDVAVNTLTKLVYNKSEKNCVCNVNSMFRVHHKNNALFSFGLENWNPCTGRPNELSTYGSFFLNHELGRFTFNAFTNFRVSQKLLTNLKFMVRREGSDNLNSYVLVNVDRELVDSTTQNSSETESKQVVKNSASVVLKAIKTLDSTTKLGAAVNYDVDTKQTCAVVSSSHNLDGVRANARLGSDRSLDLGITSVNNDLTLNFSAHTELKSSTEKVGETDVTKFWPSFKFGLTAEYNRV